MAPHCSLDRIQTVGRPLLLSPLQLPHASFYWTLASSPKGSYFLTFVFFFLYSWHEISTLTPSYPLAINSYLFFWFRKPFLTYVRVLVYCSVFHSDLKHLLHVIISENLVVHVSMTFVHCSVPVLSIVANHQLMFVEWVFMKPDFKVFELISSHTSVSFKITGTEVQIPALPLT